MTPILFFAAGKGTRMRHLTADRPKPLIPVAGKPLLDHAMDLADVDGVGQRVVNLHTKGQMIRDHLKGRDVTFSDEATLLETGGGLRHALPLLDASPVLTMNTDAVWHGPNPVTAVLQGWQDHMEGLVLVVPAARAIGHKGTGDFLTDAAGRITRGPGPIYTGLQMIRTDRFADMPDGAFSMNLVWDQMIAAGTLYGLVYDGRWCDVGQPESLPLAADMLKAADV